MNSVTAKIVAIGLASALWNTFLVARQPVIVSGTGNPNIDVPAVQAAVDRGGQVVLVGHFSFDKPASKPAGAAYRRMVTITKGVVISGKQGAQGEMPTIQGGAFPFSIEASGKHVAIRGLRFIRPKRAAIWVYAVGGLVIEGCRIEGVEASAEFGSSTGGTGSFASAIFVGSNPVPPRPGQVGEGESNSGTLSILNNDIDVGGTACDNTLGIVVFGVGRSPHKEVRLRVRGNRIKNVTERGINVNQIIGRVHIERNVIATGTVVGPSNGVQPDVIHAVGFGFYKIANNSIVSEWGTGAGIRVQGNGGFSESRAVVVENDVTMSAPEGSIFGSNSAGIEIRGSAQANTVQKNRISGRGRAALALIVDRGTPANNTLASNYLDRFQASLADVFVDRGVKNTRIAQKGATIEDQGAGTVTAPILLEMVGRSTIESLNR